MNIIIIIIVYGAVLLAHNNKMPIDNGRQLFYPSLLYI